MVWASHLQETNVGEVIAVPLTSGAELAAEGQAMRHCVGTYTRQCANGNLRIFSLRHPDGRRSTLSIVHAGNFWKISQNLAEQNRMPDKALLAVGKVIAKLYNKAEKLMGQM